MKNWLLIFLLFTAPVLASAQQKQPVKQTTQTNSKKLKKIALLMETTGAAKVGMQVMSSMLETMKIQYPSVDQKFWDEFLVESKAEDLVAITIPVYDKYFSESDIDALLAFYNSPVGKKFVATMPSIMKESMEAGEAWGKATGEKVLNKLKAKGYIKAS